MTLAPAETKESQRSVWRHRRRKRKNTGEAIKRNSEIWAKAAETRRRHQRESESAVKKMKAANVKSNEMAKYRRLTQS